jgi:hypothetical protein
MNTSPQKKDKLYAKCVLQETGKHGQNSDVQSAMWSSVLNPASGYTTKNCILVVGQMLRWEKQSIKLKHYTYTVICVLLAMLPSGNMTKDYISYQSLLPKSLL